jgi:hypothetical protein
MAVKHVARAKKRNNAGAATLSRRATRSCGGATAFASRRFQVGANFPQTRLALAAPFSQSSDARCAMRDARAAPAKRERGGRYF